MLGSVGLASLDFNHWRRAQQTIAQGALTNSKHPRTFVKGVYPTHVDHGRGAFLFAPDGERYLDFICGLGANLFGYGNPYIAERIQKELYRGYSHSLPTVLELDVADMLKQLFPFIERTKFLKTGSEACSAALRIARAATGRKLVLSEGYHGWADQFVSLTPPAIGCVDGQVRSLDDTALSEDVAAVIVEPIITNSSNDRIGWLKYLREKCTEKGILLIYDEVITGFRYDHFGVSNCYGVRPDLIVLGKSFAGGLPLSAVGGRKDLMDNDQYFVSSTFAGETLSLAAAEKCMELLLRNSDYDLTYLRRESLDFCEQFNALSSRVSIEGYGTRGRFVGKAHDLALFFQECVKAGILFGPSFFFGFQHLEHRSRVVSDLKSILARIDWERELEGEMPSSPFVARLRDGR